MIQIYGVGGLIAKIAKAAGRAKIQGHANLLNKSHPELSKLLSKLAASQKGGPKLSDKEAEKLVTLALDYRRSNIRYLERRAKINELLAARRASKPTELPTKPTQTPTEQPIPGTTLSAKWLKMKTWMNNHPKTTIGVPLLAFGTGPGRYVTGNAVKAVQSNPENWFSDSPTQSEGASDFVVINGTKIPIKKSAEGYFVPATQDTTQPPVGDDIDQALAGITNESLGEAPQLQLVTIPEVDQLTINDLFDDDQW